MTRSGFAIGVAGWILVGLAAAAHAASLAVAPDKTTYQIGETVSITVTGLPAGGSDNAIRGQLLYSAALTDTVSSSQTQTQHTTLLLPWTLVPLSSGDGFSDVFNQSRIGSLFVDQNQIATTRLIAQAVGVVNVTWQTTGPAALDFFSLVSAPGTSFTIVPEPASALLVGVGLAALAFATRRR